MQSEFTVSDSVSCFEAILNHSLPSVSFSIEYIVPKSISCISSISKGWQWDILNRLCGIESVDWDLLLFVIKSNHCLQQNDETTEISVNSWFNEKQELLNEFVLLCIELNIPAIYLEELLRLVCAVQVFI